MLWRTSLGSYKEKQTIFLSLCLCLFLFTAEPNRSSQVGEKRKGRGGGSSVSFSKEKKTEDCTALFSFPDVLLVLLLPNMSYSYSLSCSPSWDPDPSLPLLERRGRRYGSSAPFSEVKKTKDCAERLSLVSFSLSFPLFPSFSSFPSYSPFPSAQMRVLLGVFSHGLIVSFVRFVRSPARFPHHVHCSAASFSGVLPTVLGLLIWEADCNVKSEQQGSKDDFQLWPPLLKTIAIRTDTVFCREIEISEDGSKCESYENPQNFQLLDFLVAPCQNQNLDPL